MSGPEAGLQQAAGRSDRRGARPPSARLAGGRATVPGWTGPWRRHVCARTEHGPHFAEREGTGDEDQLVAHAASASTRDIPAFATSLRMSSAASAAGPAAAVIDSSVSSSLLPSSAARRTIMVRSEDSSWSVRARRWARSRRRTPPRVVATPTLSPTRPHEPGHRAPHAGA